MKTAIIAISMIMMLLLTGGMALAAPSAPGDQGHGQGVEQAKDHGQSAGQAENQSQAQDHSQTQGSDQNEQQGQDKGQAQGKESDKGKSQGKVPGFDKRHGAAGTVKADLTAGSASFVLVTKQGEDITVKVGTNTLFFNGGKPVTFGTLSGTVLAAGDRVNVNGTRDSNNNYDMTAKLVHKIPTQASVEHFVGTVESYTAANGTTNGSIKIKDRRTGQDVTFTVTSGTKIEGKNPPASGDLVTVVAPSGGSNTTARGIAVETLDNDKNQGKDNNN